MVVVGRRGIRRLWVALGAVIFLALIAAAAAVGVANSGVLVARHSVDVEFELSDPSDEGGMAIELIGTNCSGKGGYNDIGPGTPAVIKDGEGQILAAATLADGVGNERHCTFAFTFEDVPEVPFYTVEVGRRGALSYSLEDMKSRSWSVGLSLGD